MRNFLLINMLCFAFVTIATAKQKMEWVDLGLPSGTLWATCNVGAESPTDMGDRFAWGETISFSKKRSLNTHGTYKYSYKDRGFYTKYNPIESKSNTDYFEFIDYKMMLDPEDDAATVNCGEECMMPTGIQFRELMYYCTPYYKGLNGNNFYDDSGRPGILFKSKKNGNSIFLPLDTTRSLNLAQAGNNKLRILPTDYSKPAPARAKYWAKTINEYVDDRDSVKTLKTDSYHATVLRYDFYPSKPYRRIDRDSRPHYNYIRPVRRNK